ncbi:MXAN_6577-like cysteine-rich protein [Sorangium sp. So ce1153]|uniref:MXAN_6577-like cysteine-rich protein n=1 Tax=Sorangium sp. So ce1153 TaxID=3133333 RepID=UPI003F613190
MNNSGLRLRPTLSSAALLLVAGVVVAASCAEGDDEPSACADGQSQCDGECVDTQANAEHCGACDNACAEGQRCEAGLCGGGGGGGGGGGEGGRGGDGGGGDMGGVEECGEGETACGTSCVDLETNPRHCGKCDDPCAEGQVCTDGACGCADGLTDCDGACVDVQSDRTHCGSCEASCSPTQLCAEGACTCSAELTDCGGSCANLQTSELHCGSCETACERGAFCQAGACTCVIGTHEELSDTFPQTVTGTTVGGETNYGLACVAAGSSERVYLFTPSEAGTYTMDTVGSAFDTAIGVVSATNCAQLGCNDDNDGAQSKVRAVIEAGQSVLIVVTGFDGAEGDFALNLAKAGPPICPSGEVSEALPQTFTGNTELLGDAITPSCGHAGGPDVSYTFTAPADGKYVFDTFGSEYNTVLELQDGGCNGDVIECNNDSRGGMQSRITAELSAGQTVVVVVDGFEGASGAYTLNISEWEPPPCPMIDLGSTYPQTVMGNTSGLDNYLQASCASGESPEVSYSFTAPADGRYTFNTTGSTFDTVLHVHDGSCTGTSLGCNDGSGSASQVVTPLVAGQTAYVVVDGAYGAAGAYTLNVTGIPAPPCPAIPLEPVVPQTVTGTTAGLGDFVSAPCGVAGGAEATYSFTAPSDGVYIFDTFGSAFDTVVHVHDATCGGTSLGCNDNTTGVQSRVAVPLVAGQVAVVVVDGSGAAASGAFNLNISLFEGNATCVSPVDLGSTVPQTVTGSTLLQPNSGTPSCTTSGASGNDRVYRFTAPADGTYVIDTVSSTFDTVLHVHEGDSCSGAELACNDNAVGVASRVNVPLTAGQVITIVADSRPSSSGNLTLHITAAP